MTEEEVDRVTAAKAADSLLKINGVNASVVVFRAGDDVLVSARSNGTVNVQLLMEQLGGGGNHSSAGARIIMVRCVRSRQTQKMRFVVIRKMRTATINSLVIPISEYNRDFKNDGGFLQ